MKSWELSHSPFKPDSLVCPAFFSALSLDLSCLAFSNLRTSLSLMVMYFIDFPNCFKFKPWTMLRPFRFISSFLVWKKKKIQNYQIIFINLPFISRSSLLSLISNQSILEYNEFWILRNIFFNCLILSKRKSCWSKKILLVVEKNHNKHYTIVAIMCRNDELSWLYTKIFRAYLQNVAKSFYKILLLPFS